LYSLITYKIAGENEEVMIEFKEIQHLCAASALREKSFREMLKSLHKTGDYPSMSSSLSQFIAAKQQPLTL